MATLDDLDALVKAALSEGARAAEVYHRSATGWAIQARGGGTPKAKETSTERLEVRVWVDGGRVGRMHGKLSQGMELVGQALASTFESPEDSHAGPVQRLGGAPSGLGTADRRHKHLSVDDRIEVVTDAIRQAKGPDSRFQPGDFTYRDALEWRGIANSRGVQAEEVATTFRLDGALEVAGLSLEEHLSARMFASIASIPLGTRLVNRALELLEDGKQLESGPVRVVMMPLAVSRMLGALGECFTPERLAGKKFFLTPPEDDSATLSAKLHVVDDGARPGALRTRSFDDRGVPPVPLTLIREGHLDGRFLDPETARRFDTRPTGHCWEKGLGASNLLMRAGTRSVNALLTELGGPALWLDDVDFSKLNLKTGAFRATVDGRVLDANKFVGAMRGVTLHGNLFDLLTQVVDVGNNTDRIGHVDAAAIIADGLMLDA